MASVQQADTPSTSTYNTFFTTKDLDLNDLVQGSGRFCRITRIPATAPDLSAVIEDHERTCTPLIIEGWHKNPGWPSDMFSIDWLLMHGQQEMSARNIHDWSDRTLPLSEFVQKSRDLPKYCTQGETERLYGKDAQCPGPWSDWLDSSQILPERVLPKSDHDVMQHLPDEDRVETLMCYLGVGDTFTPCHKDLCASSGQNLMCYTENGGSSFWFMTKGSDAAQVSRYFQRHLNQELDYEAHVVSVEQLRCAPFDVYVGEQQLGDLVLVPPRSCHQVVNNGGITIKTSWSRMTVSGLRTALYHELPIYRRVCRPETYRIKATIYHAMLSHAARLLSVPSNTSIDAEESRQSGVPHHDIGPRLADELESLLFLFDEILTEEYCESHAEIEQITAEETTARWNLHCDFCGADIFQSLFECGKCVNAKDGDEAFLMCAGCYVEGRRCRCDVMQPKQVHQFTVLITQRNESLDVLSRARSLPPTLRRIRVQSFEGDISTSCGFFIFDAACKLLRQRVSCVGKIERNNGTRSCTLRGNRDPHRVSRDAGLHCLACHAFKCFWHMLADHYIHSARAILSHALDDDNSRWHRRHQEGHSIFKDRKGQVMESRRTGQAQQLEDLLVIAAQDYQSCKPINHRFCRKGWYDMSVYRVHEDESDLADNATYSTALFRPLLTATGQSNPEVNSDVPLSLPSTSPELAGTTIGSFALGTPPSDHFSSTRRISQAIVSGPSATRSRASSHLAEPLAEGVSRAGMNTEAVTLRNPSATDRKGRKRTASPLLPPMKRHKSHKLSDIPAVRQRLVKRPIIKRDSSPEDTENGQESDFKPRPGPSKRTSAPHPATSSESRRRCTGMPKPRNVYASDGAQSDYEGTTPSIDSRVERDDSDDQASQTVSRDSRMPATDHGTALVFDNAPGDDRLEQAVPCNGPNRNQHADDRILELEQLVNAFQERSERQKQKFEADVAECRQENLALVEQLKKLRKRQTNTETALDEEKTQTRRYASTIDQLQKQVDALRTQRATELGHTQFLYREVQGSMTRSLDQMQSQLNRMQEDLSRQFSQSTFVFNSSSSVQAASSSSHPADNESPRLADMLASVFREALAQPPSSPTRAINYSPPDALPVTQQERMPAFSTSGSPEMWSATDHDDSAPQAMDDAAGASGDYSWGFDGEDTSEQNRPVPYMPSSSDVKTEEASPERTRSASLPPEGPRTWEPNPNFQLHKGVGRRNGSDSLNEHTPHEVLPESRFDFSGGHSSSRPRSHGSTQHGCATFSTGHRGNKPSRGAHWRRGRHGRVVSHDSVRYNAHGPRALSPLSQEDRAVTPPRPPNYRRPT